MKSKLLMTAALIAGLCVAVGAKAAQPAGTASDASVAPLQDQGVNLATAKKAKLHFSIKGVKVDDEDGDSEGADDNDGADGEGHESNS